MRLTNLTLQVNEYSYEIEGVQPGGYTGKAKFSDLDGTMTIKLPLETIQRILEAVAEESHLRANELASKVTIGSIVNAQNGNILEHHPIPADPRDLP